MINYTFLKEVFMSTFLLSYFLTFLLLISATPTVQQIPADIGLFAESNLI
jgi:hypothetical protein